MKLTIIDSTGAAIIIGPRSFQHLQSNKGQELRTTILSKTGADPHISYSKLIAIHTPEEEGDPLSDITQKKIKLLFNKLLDSVTETDSVNLLVVDLGEYAQVQKDAVSRSYDRLSLYINSLYGKNIDTPSPSKKFNVIMMDATIPFEQYPKVDAAHFELQSWLDRKRKFILLTYLPSFNNKLLSILQQLVNLSKNGLEIYESTPTSDTTFTNHIQYLFQKEPKYTVSKIDSQNGLLIKAPMKTIEETKRLISKEECELRGKKLLEYCNKHINPRTNSSVKNRIYTNILNILNKVYKWWNKDTLKKINRLNVELNSLEQESLSPETNSDPLLKNKGQVIRKTAALGLAATLAAYQGLFNNTVLASDKSFSTLTTSILGLGVVLGLVLGTYLTVKKPDSGSSI